MFEVLAQECGPINYIPMGVKHPNISRVVLTMFSQVGVRNASPCDQDKNAMRATAEDTRQYPQLPMATPRIAQHAVQHSIKQHAYASAEEGPTRVGYPS